MKKLFFILLFSFNFCFSQTSTEKWNDLKKQYEYFDSNGNMTAYKVYNSFKKQWETFTVQPNNYQPQPVVNTELVQKTLSTLQSKYDDNFAKLKKEVGEATTYIYVTAKANGYNYEAATKAYNFYKLNYIDKVSNGGYDLSSNTLTDKLSVFLSDGALKVGCDFFKDCP